MRKECKASVGGMCQKAGGREQLPHQSVCGRSGPSQRKTRTQRRLGMSQWRCREWGGREVVVGRATTYWVASGEVQIRSRAGSRKRRGGYSSPLPPSQLLHSGSLQFETSFLPKGSIPASGPSHHSQNLMGALESFCKVPKTRGSWPIQLRFEELTTTGPSS